MVDGCCVLLPAFLVRVAKHLILRDNEEPDASQLFYFKTSATKGQQHA